MENTLYTPQPLVVLTVGQAAQYLGLAISTLNKWRCHGGGPTYIKMGRAVRYKQEDLDRFVNEARTSSTSEWLELN